MAASSRPSRCASRGSTNARSSGSRRCSSSVARSFCARRGGLLVLRDPAPHPDHVRQRPIGHSLAVGQTASPVPVHLVDDPVEVLVELPREARLADPRDPGHRDQVRPPVLGGTVEELLDQLQLALAADERRLQPGRLERAADARDDPQRARQRHRLGLAFQLLLPGALVDDRLLGRPARHLTDEHRARLGRRLDPRGGVDEVARHHPLALGADRHRRFTRQHTRPRLQRRIQLRDRRDEVERRSHRPLGVTLGRNRRPPDRHHRVADELFHRPPVPGDQRPRQLEIPRQQVARLLRIARLRQRREADEIREQHRHQPALGNRLGTAGCRRRRRSHLADASSPNGEPHWLQNRIAGSLAVPQAAQIWLSGAPQPPQKRELAGFSTPQLEHVVTPRA